MKKHIIIFTLFSSVYFCFGQVSVVGPGGMVVQMDTTRGTIALGDTADNKLMFNFDYPWTRSGNWLTFMCDSDGFSNSTDVAYSYGYTYLGSHSAGSGYWGGSVSKEWNVPYGSGHLFFRITVTPIELDGAGVAKIALYAMNGDDEPHEIGAMFSMDTYIGDNDRAPLTTGTSLLSRCTILEDEEVPYFWQAYEESPSAGCDQVIARGFLRGFGATPPNMFVLADLMYLWRQPWEIDTSFVGNTYFDSAILIRWAKQSINPDKSATFITYYGFGRCDDESTSVMLISLVPGKLTPICTNIETPFEVAALIHNRSIASGMSAGTLCVEIPSGTELVSNPLHPDEPCIAIDTDPLLMDSSTVAAWLVNITTTEIWGDTIPIIMNLTAEPGISISSTSFVAIPDPDGNPPIVELDFPYRFVSCSDSGSVTIPFYLYEDTEIDLTSLSIKMGDALLTNMSGYLNYEGDTLFAEIPQWMLHHGDTIDYRFLSVMDIYNCSPDSYPPAGTLFIDLEPPEFHGFYPSSDSTLAPVPQIRIHIIDEPAGVDTSSVYLQFDGAVIYPDDPRVSWEDDSTLVFTSTDTFPDGYPIVICLTGVSDRAELCGPNTLSTLDCETYFVNKINELQKPKKFSLQALPNPFNSSCEIIVYSPSADRAKISICDISGHNISTIFDDILITGMNKFVWNADAKNSSGIYFVVVECGNNRIIKRIALIK